MNVKITLLLILSLVLTCFASIGYANAAPVAIQDLPERVAYQFTIDEWLAGMLLSIGVLMLVMLPTIYLTKGKQMTLYIIFALAVLAPLVGLGWFDLWAYIIILLAIAAGFSKQLINFFGGIGR